MKNNIYNTQFNTLFYLPLSYLQDNVDAVIEKCNKQKIRVVNLVIDKLLDVNVIWALIDKLEKADLNILIGFKFISKKTISNSNWNGMVIFKIYSKKAISTALEILRNEQKVIDTELLVKKLAKFDYLLIPFYSINDTTTINKQDIFLDINNGVYVQVANILKHMVFNSVGNVFKKQQDVIGMINEMMYPFLPKDSEEVHYMLHKIITIFSYIFNSENYFDNIMQFKRYPNAIGVFKGFSNYLKTPFRTEHISLINVSFSYVSYVNFKFDMNIDLNLYYANMYKDSPIYRIRSKLLKKFQWWANDKNMWVVIAFAIFFYINTLIAFFTNWTHKNAASGDLAFIATYYANMVTIFNTYFIFAYFSSVFTFIYNYITVKRLIMILLTKNLKFDVSSKDIDLVYLIKMTNGYLVSLGLEQFLITIGGKQPLTIDEYHEQLPFFKYSFFAHQRQLINVFVVRLVILGILTLATWGLTTAFGQYLKDFNNSIWWVIGCTGMLLFNFAWSGLNVLETIIPNPTNWITYKTITAYKPIKIDFIDNYVVLKNMDGKVILNTKDMSNWKIRFHIARLFTNHVYSAKTYFVLDNNSELIDIANYMFNHKVKIYINYLFNDYLQKNNASKSDIYLEGNEIDLNKYFTEIKDKELFKAYQAQQAQILIDQENALKQAQENERIKALIDQQNNQ